MVWYMVMVGMICLTMTGLFMFLLLFRLKLDVSQPGSCLVLLGVRLKAVSPPELTASGYPGRHETWRLAVAVSVRGAVRRNVR